MVAYLLKILLDEHIIRVVEDDDCVSEWNMDYNFWVVDLIE
jgi:hypothetical protein